jgi:hypothetical protein
VLRDGQLLADVDGLLVAIRSAFGIETLTWLVDIAGYARDEAAATVRATAHALPAGRSTTAGIAAPGPGPRAPGVAAGGRCGGVLEWTVWPTTPTNA